MLTLRRPLRSWYWVSSQASRSARRDCIMTCTGIIWWSSGIHIHRYTNSKHSALNAFLTARSLDMVIMRATVLFHCNFRYSSYFYHWDVQSSSLNHHKHSSSQKARITRAWRALRPESIDWPFPGPSLGHSQKRMCASFTKEIPWQYTETLNTAPMEWRSNWVLYSHCKSCKVQWRRMMSCAKWISTAWVKASGPFVKTIHEDVVQKRPSWQLALQVSQSRMSSSAMIGW